MNDAGSKLTHWGPVNNSDEFMHSHDREDNKSMKISLYHCILCMFELLKNIIKHFIRKKMWFVCLMAVFYTCEFLIG